MTRAELVNAVAERNNLSPKDADKLVRSVVDILQEKISDGEKITISGFGTFERRLRKATMARNPKTHEPMPISAQYVATFRAGSALKEAVKSTAD